MKDFKMEKFLIDNEVYNTDEVRCIHLFGIWWDDNTIVHHSVKSFEDLYEYTHQFDYQRIMVIFNNGGSVAWDIDPDFFREGLNHIENISIEKTPMVIESLVN